MASKVLSGLKGASYPDEKRERSQAAMLGGGMPSGRYQ